MILDAGPLVDADRDRRRFAALVKAALEHDDILRTTAAIVAQVWRSPRQANLAWALSAVHVSPDFGDGRRIGELLATTGSADAIDAHLAVLGRRTNEPILTADLPDMSRLAEAAGAIVIDWNG